MDVQVSSDRLRLFVYDYDYVYEKPETQRSAVNVIVDVNEESSVWASG